MTGAIHDLGYKRYLGTRRPQSTRWRVIVRNQLATAWKTWWRFKLALGFSVVVLLGMTIVLVLAYEYAPALERLLNRFGVKGNPYDTITTIAVPWLCRAAFLASLTVGAGAVAADAQAGAFTFYFARPVRPIDYVLGKLGGLFLLFNILITAPLFALTCLRIGLSADGDAMLAALPRLGSALVTGACGALVFSALPLGISALVSRRGYAIGLWAVWYLVVASIMVGLGFAFHQPALGAFDPLLAIDGIAQHLYGAEFMPQFQRQLVPLGWALAVTLATSAGAIALAYVQVARRADQGVGGS